MTSDGPAQQRTDAALRFVAFLRAINVGGHNVKMERLRSLFESIGLKNVETFIASGNVIFDSPGSNTQMLEAEIEGWLEQSLGYGVATFVRSTDQVAGISRYEPFARSELDTDGNLMYVAFLRDAPDEAACRRLMGLRNQVDDFRVHDREIYWLRRRNMGESAFSGALLEKTLGQPATMRNMNTVRRIVAKYPASP